MSSFVGSLYWLVTTTRKILGLRSCVQARDSSVLGHFLSYCFILFCIVVYPMLANCSLTSCPYSIQLCLTMTRQEEGSTTKRDGGDIIQSWAFQTRMQARMNNLNASSCHLWFSSHLARRFLYWISSWLPLNCLLSSRIPEVLYICHIHSGSGELTGIHSAIQMLQVYLQNGAICCPSLPVTPAFPNDGIDSSSYFVSYYIQVTMIGSSISQIRDIRPSFSTCMCYIFFCGLDSC